MLEKRALVARLRQHVDKQTRESLNERFGISYNTWRRLMSGEPVRQSVILRLEKRLDLLDQQLHTSNDC
ncbi:hypothetical protein CVO77_19735 (plasmid) [Sphingopyxis lindanitolerans]|uniref:XRE family transcriptional regulator n=1 Tax=Sphingopyxis lindanitolerans TaxID=2054227 RepID=A0A2S8B0B6_9SPHN|nr:hypothetical protein CVO77_19735 [Sphingopyxis lindanitolerans]